MSNPAGMQMDKPPSRPPRTPTTAPAPLRDPPAKDVQPMKVRHEGGRAVLQWAADTARMLALSASQVMRKLDTSSLKLDEEEPPRGQPMARRGEPLPGGGMNPYENKGPRRSPPPRSREPHRTAAPTRAPAASPHPPASSRARTSWWRRLFQRG